MNKTVVKVIGIISLITFLIGVAVSIFGIVGGNYFFDVSSDAYSTYETTDPGADLLVAIIMLFGSGLLGTVTIVGGILVGLYDLIAHIPALIAYLVGRKGNHVTIYWILISLWLCLLLGTSVFILVF